MENLEIKKLTRDVVDSLGFFDRKTSKTPTENSVKTYKYVVQNINPNPNYVSPNLGDKKSNYERTLIDALTNNPGLPTHNNILLNHLFRSINMESYIVECLVKESGVRTLATLAKIGREFYYFRPSLERQIDDEKNIGTSRLIMVCAALGKNEFERLCTPLSIMQIPGERTRTTFPRNIADEGISDVIINAINFRIPSLVRDTGKRPKAVGEDREFE